MFPSVCNQLSIRIIHRDDIIVDPRLSFGSADELPVQSSNNFINTLCEHDIVVNRLI